MNLYYTAKEDLQYIFRDIPKWQIAVLALSAMVFVRGSKRTKWVMGTAITVMGYKWIYPYLQELDFKYRYGSAYRDDMQRWRGNGGNAGNGYYGGYGVDYRATQQALGYNGGNAGYNGGGLEYGSPNHHGQWSEDDWSSNWNTVQGNPYQAQGTANYENFYGNSQAHYNPNVNYQATGYRNPENTYQGNSWRI